MDANPLFVAVIMLHFMLCLASKGEFDGAQDVVLPESMFQTFFRTTQQQCRRLCVYSSRCLSVNWSTSTRECQLNSKKGNRESLQVADNNMYLQVQQITQQGHPCATQPCSAKHMCIPVNTAKRHVCVRIGGLISQTTTTTTTTTTTPAATTTRVATTTAAAATPVVITTTTTATTTPTTIPASTTTTTTTTAATFTPSATTTTTFTPSAATTTTITTTSTTTSAPMATTSVQASTSTATLASTTKPYNGTCITDIDCVVRYELTCSGGVCICSIGYDMDETSVKCRKLTACSSVGSDFTLYLNLAIRGHNVRMFESKTPAECAKLCVDAKDIVCRSFEDYNHNCFLQILTWFDVGKDDHRTLANVGHYQRRCKW